MATYERQSSLEIENRLKEKRQAAGFSQKQLAELAGITRQAISAIEANHYSPATSVALQLARALTCRVEDLFNIKSGGEYVEGELLGELPEGARTVRARVTQIGDRVLVRPLDGFGELISLTGSADGVIVIGDAKRKRIKVKLLKHRDTLRQQVVMGGCDPAMFLAAEYLRRRDHGNLVPYLMGSGNALGALKRGEVHVAGIHLADERSGSWNLPNLKRILGGMDCVVITFAHWEEGLIVRKGNPKNILEAESLARANVKIVNRESGSGARRLLDRRLQSSGIEPEQIRGYNDEVLSHLAVASRVQGGLADAGVGVRAAAAIFGLDFVPLQHGRYDLVIPKIHYQNLPGLKTLLDTMVSKPFREELEALGGYDTRESGKVVEMRQ
jgi:molybdopterin molybdotransferase/putative molybdopterin biosynthesis protein